VGIAAAMSPGTYGCGAEQQSGDQAGGRLGRFAGRHAGRPALRHWLRQRPRRRGALARAQRADKPPRVAATLPAMSGPGSWSSKLCVRCGTARTSNVSNGEPVCSPCLVRAREYAAREGSPERRCPADGTVMEFVVGEGICLDRCPQCSGVFLGKKQLETLRHASRDSGYSDAFFLHTLLGLV
jgi:hypothetical protein